MSRAQATRHRDLEKLLDFAARRRLARSATGNGTPASLVEPAGAPASTAQATASRRAPPQTGDAPRLVERVNVTEDLMRLIVSRSPGFDYLPGQHVKLGLPGILRTYSLVSAPHERHLEFFVEIFPGGRLSQRLRALEPGAAMAVGDRAKGDLALDTRCRNQLLVATVTGIAPYVSLLRDHFHRSAPGGHRFVILHGASYADELGYAGELTELARRHPQSVTYVPTVSRPGEARNAGWRGARGRVETHLDTLLARLALTPADTAAFACGNPDMVRSVAGAFRRRGFTTYTEPFD